MSFSFTSPVCRIAHEIPQCKELLNLCQPRNFADNQDLYMAVLSSLSKAILLQAEVEVTAEKRSAVPLARVASFFVQNLDRFPQIFFMKLVQRTGGWPIPVKPSPEEGIEYSKLAGFREDEGLPEYTSRVAGLMRVYFHVLMTPTNQPTNIFFRPTTYWTYFARLMCDRGLLESGPVGPELLASEHSLPYHPSFFIDLSLHIQPHLMLEAFKQEKSSANSGTS